MPDVSIMISAQDNYSSAIKSMSQTTKSFSKQAEDMEKILHRLNTNKTTLKLDADSSLKELKEAQKQFAATGKEADGLKVQLAQANYDNVKRNLDLVTKGAREAERQMQNTGEAFRKAENRGGISGGFGSIVNALAVSGIGNMVSQVAQQGANTIASSVFGEEVGTVFSSGLSSAISGMAAGTMLLGPGIGTALGAAAGGIVGVVSGKIQNFQKQDDAYKSYAQEQYSATRQSRATELEGGTGIAAGRETDLISFSTLFKDKGTAETYLSDLVDMANTTPFLYDDLTAMSKTLATYGYGADSILPVLETVGDTGAALGMSTSDMGMVSTALGRMKSSNKTTLEYLNILNDRGVGAVGMLADAYGVDQGKMYDMISKGKVEGGKAVKIILSALTDSFSGSMQEQSQTFSGLSSTAEGLRQEMNNATGIGYNEGRKPGIQAEINAYGGDLGDAMVDVNKMIGSSKAFAENMSEEYMREVMSAVFKGSQTTLEGLSNEKLQEMHTQYEEYKAAYDNGDQAAGLQIETLKSSAEDMAKQAYQVSDIGIKVHDAEMSLLEAIQDNTNAIQAWKPGYDFSIKGSEGQAAANARLFAKMPVDDSLDSDYTNRMMAKARAMSGYAYGLNRVPRDNFPALLHEGERVLTASQARQQDGGGGGNVSVQITGPVTVREEADIGRVAQALAREIQRAKTLRAP